MRSVLIAATVALPLACAHQQPKERNLAQRQQVTAPRSDFEGAQRREVRDNALQRVEKPLVTPPVP
jgi:hypothetical protein